MPPKTLAYLDTSVLLPIMGYEELVSDDKSAMNKMLVRHIFRIPQVVLGESLAVILERNPGANWVSEWTNMLTILHGKLEFATDRFPSPTSEIIKIASELHDRDNEIKNMDSLILAHPIADNDTAHFYTDDRAMRSSMVHEYIHDCISNNVRDQKLNILQCFNQS